MKAMQDFDLEYTQNGVTITTRLGRVHIGSLDVPSLAIRLLQDADKRGWVGGRDINRLRPILDEKTE